MEFKQMIVPRIQVTRMDGNSASFLSGGSFLKFLKFGMFIAIAGLLVFDAYKQFGKRTPPNNYHPSDRSATFKR